MSKQVTLLAGERKKGESQKAVIACNDYLRMGSGRTLRRLEEKYREIPRNTAPTQSPNTLQKWSQAFDWQARADTFDAEREAEKDARRKEIMEAGLALDYERVNKLVSLADFLESQITYGPEPVEDESDADEMTDDEFTDQLRREQGDPTALRPMVWVRDYKQIGSGEFAEKVEIVRFNAALISEYRSALDDLAKETGGRKQKMEHDITDKAADAAALIAAMRQGTDDGSNA